VGLKISCSCQESNLSRAACTPSLHLKHNLLRPWSEILDLLYSESEFGNKFINQHCEWNSYRGREKYHIKTLGVRITQIYSGKQPCITHTSSDTGHATVEVWALTKKRRKNIRRKRWSRGERWVGGR
jgi:hypothetical protein